MDFEPVWSAMEGVFGDDERRKEHARQVTRYAEELLRNEPGDAQVVITTAILHDVGIPASIRKYGNANGPNQEREGPPIARRILEGLEYPKEVTEEVCAIIASHHSPGEVDTDNFRIVYDADWLVNMPDQYGDINNEQSRKVIEKIFKTDKGKEIATKLYAS